MTAASALDPVGLNTLRAWIDAQLAAAPDPALSAQEATVIRLLAQGHSNKEIGRRLKVSVKTVETYKARAMEKLSVRSRTGLVQYALRRGWLSAPDDPAATDEE